MKKTTTKLTALSVLVSMTLLTGCGTHKDTKSGDGYTIGRYTSINDIKGAILDFYGYEMMIMGYISDNKGNLESQTSTILYEYETCSMYPKSEYTYQCVRLLTGTEHQEVFVFDIDNSGIIHGVVGIQDNEADGFTSYDLSGDARYMITD